MHEHELELIAALVEGRLEDESEARALIDASPELRQEYEAQRLAYETLQEAGTASLQDTERAALHRDIWTELRSGPAEPASKTPWYYRWAPVAAGLLVVVGLVSVLGQGGDDAGEETFTLAADSAATTTTAAAAGLMDESEGEAAPGDDDGGSEEAAAADTLSEEALNIYQREADLLRQGVYGERLRSYDSADTTIETCVEESGLDGHRILATLSAPMGETDTPEDERRLAVAYPEDAQLEAAPISFVDLEVCEVVYTDE
ncbi:MAG TPA: hypothetical protein VIG24_19385 [Acidimicrobiia bacterium]